MKILLRCVLLCTLYMQGTAKAKTQTDPKVGCDTSAVIGVSGKIHIANTGFAPIPAFSFNEPIAIVSLTIRKKRFSYEPDFALGLNGVPWMINNWLNIKIIDRQKYNVVAGVNPSLFFESKLSDFGKDVLFAQRSLSLSLSTAHKLSKRGTLNFMFLHNKAFDPDALSGNFFLIGGSYTPLPLSEKVYLELKQELFYFDFGSLNGLCTSSVIRIFHHRIPISLVFQGVLPLWTNFTGNHFKWNTGLTFSF